MVTHLHSLTAAGYPSSQGSATATGHRSGFVVGYEGVPSLRRPLVVNGSMTLQVVGAGLGRTGTHSLKVAFEQLLGGPCYHMVEVFGRPDQRDTWAAAVRGEKVDWAAFLAPYRATVDWPAA